jgi:hypothetical protein
MHTTKLDGVLGNGHYPFLGSDHFYVWRFASLAIILARKELEEEEGWVNFPKGVVLGHGPKSFTTPSRIRVG